jgi:hypothetical protein
MDFLSGVFAVLLQAARNEIIAITIRMDFIFLFSAFKCSTGYSSSEVALQTDKDK